MVDDAYIENLREQARQDGLEICNEYDLVEAVAQQDTPLILNILALVWLRGAVSALCPPQAEAERILKGVQHGA